MKKNADYWIEKLGLKPHPEGGAYVETYRSSLQIPGEGMGISGSRSLATSIYFLLKKEGFSSFHKIKSDEAWHFYTGSQVVIYEIDDGGTLLLQKIGPNPENGEVFQHVVKAGRWFAARIEAAGEFSLVGCTVSPGFDFQDFELANRNNLVYQYPQHTEIITQLTY